MRKGSKPNRTDPDSCECHGNQDCSPSPELNLVQAHKHPELLQKIVEHYRQCYHKTTVDEIEWFKSQPNLETAIRTAAQAKCSHGKVLQPPAA